MKKRNSRLNYKLNGTTSFIAFLIIITFMFSVNYSQDQDFIAKDYKFNENKNLLLNNPLKNIFTGAVDFFKFKPTGHSVQGNILYINPTQGATFNEDQNWDPLGTQFECDFTDNDGAHHVLWNLYKGGVLFSTANEYSVAQNSPGSAPTTFNFKINYPVPEGIYEWECIGTDSIGNKANGGKISLTVSKASSIPQNYIPTRMYPSDFVYFGAFDLTTGSGDEFAYVPIGDKGVNDPDGYPGSLYVNGLRPADCIAEVSIPNSSFNFNNLPKSAILQSCGDISVSSSLGPLFSSQYSWQQGPSDTHGDYGGIEYLPARGIQTSDKLYFSLYRKYPGGSDQYSVGYSELNINNPQAQGLFHLGSLCVNNCNPNPWHFNKWSSYMFKIPQSFADQYLNGYSMGIGRNRLRFAQHSHKGPSIYAFKPYDTDILQHGVVNNNALELVRYNHQGGSLLSYPGYKDTDKWKGATWIQNNLGTKSAILISGEKAFGRCEYFDSCSNGGDADRRFDPCNCGNKGNKCSTEVSEILFYDPLDLASVAQGTKQPDQVVPYVAWNPRAVLTSEVPNFACKEIGLNGLEFDDVNKILYVKSGTIIHVFKLQSQSCNSNNNCNDNNACNGIETCQNNICVPGTPIIIDDGVSCTIDTCNVNTGAVTNTPNNNACDDGNSCTTDLCNINLGCQNTNIINCTNLDTIPPIITNIQSTSITSNSATITWNTNELSNSIISYGTSSGNYSQNVSNQGNVLTHSIILPNLQPSTTYFYKVKSIDTSNNQKTSSENSFITLTSSGTTTTSSGSSGGSSGSSSSSTGSSTNEENVQQETEKNPDSEQEDNSNLIDLTDSNLVEESLSVGSYKIELVSGVEHDLYIDEIDNEKITITIDGKTLDIPLGTSQVLFLDGYSLQLFYSENNGNNAKLEISKGNFLLSDRTKDISIIISVIVLIALGTIYIYKNKKSLSNFSRNK